MTITPMTAVPAAHAQQLGLTPVETLEGKIALEGIINVWRAFIREGGDYRTATGIVTNGQNDFWVAVAPPQDNPAFNLWSFIMPKVAPHWAALANGGPRLVSPNLSPVTLSQIVMPANGPLASIGTPDALAAALRAPIFLYWFKHLRSYALYLLIRHERTPINTLSTFKVWHTAHPVQEVNVQSGVVTSSIALRYSRCK